MDDGWGPSERNVIGPPPESIRNGHESQRRPRQCVEVGQLVLPMPTLSRAHLAGSLLVARPIDPADVRIVDVLAISKGACNGPNDVPLSVGDRSGRVDDAGNGNRSRRRWSGPRRIRGVPAVGDARPIGPDQSSS